MLILTVAEQIDDVLVSPLLCKHSVFWNIKGMLHLWLADLFDHIGTRRTGRFL